MIQTVHFILIYPVHLKVIWAVHLKCCSQFNRSKSDNQIQGRSVRKVSKGYFYFLKLHIFDDIFK